MTNWTERLRQSAGPPPNTIDATRAWKGAKKAKNRTPPPLAAYWQRRYPRYHLAQHIQLMLNELQNLQDGEALIITVAPRHSKSESVKAWLEWSLGQHSDADTIIASYSVDLARRVSKAIRNEIQMGAAFPRDFSGITIAADSAAATDWATNQGGRCRAAGVGGGITGMGARFAVIDDPFKDRRDAESELMRQNVWEWFTSAFLTRLTPDARVVLTHTRWHEDDLAGRILARVASGDNDELGGLKWKHLNLLAIYDDPAIVDPLGREVGQALWPERYDLKRLEGIRDANPYDFEALYQQRPRRLGGTVFLDGFGTYQEPQQGKLYITVDTAASKRETADFSALTVWSVTGQGADLRADILENVRQRLSITEFLAVGRRLQAAYGCPLHIEQTSQSLPIIQYLQSEGLTVIGVTVKGDKFTRAQPYAAAWNQGRIRLPADSPAWLSAFLAEHLAFTGTDADKHDDTVDTGSLLFMVAAVTIEQTTRRSSGFRNGMPLRR